MADCFPLAPRLVVTIAGRSFGKKAGLYCVVAEIRRSLSCSRPASQISGFPAASRAPRETPRDMRKPEVLPACQMAVPSAQMDLKWQNAFPPIRKSPNFLRVDTSSMEQENGNGTLGH